MSAAARPVSQLPVLVLEDEPSVMAFLTSALERKGYLVVAAPTGEEGIRLLESRDFRGVVSDIRMPGEVSGADVHHWIAAHRPNLVGRVVFVTGDIVSEETVTILRQTQAPCIEKPFRVQQLISVVEQTLGRAQ